VAGTLGEGAHEVPGVDACTGILPAPMALAEAMVRASELLTDATERALRMMSLGALVTEAQRSYGRASDAPRARREVTSSTTS
jgi:glycerate kinase